MFGKRIGKLEKNVRFELLAACSVFQKKVFRAKIVPKIYCSCVWSLYYCLRIKKGRYLRTTLNVYTTE